MIKSLVIAGAAGYVGWWLANTKSDAFIDRMQDFWFEETLRERSLSFREGWTKALERTSKGVIPTAEDLEKDADDFASAFKHRKVEL